MKYYKLIEQENIIGVITSSEFLTYSPNAECYLISSEATGEYVTYKNKLYRDSWMSPYQLYFPHKMVTIVETTYEEYKILKEALKEEEQIKIIIEDDEEPSPSEDTDPIGEATVDFVRSTKLRELTRTCQKRIEAGFNWGDKHYSLTKEDQINLLNAQLMINGGETSVLYHADGEDYRYFNAEEILALVERATNWRLDHTIYLKSLKQRVNAATTIEEIAAITYEK